MKRLRQIVATIGSLGCLSLCLFSVAFVREVVRYVNKVFTPVQVVSVETLVTEIRRVGSLKPLRVVKSGFDRVDRCENGSCASLDYQYKGMAEYAVNLQKMTTRWNTNVDDVVKLEIILPMPKLEDPLCFPIEGRTLWKVKSDWSMRHWKVQFGYEMPTILSDKIREAIDTYENREKAKEQTKAVLLCMFEQVVEKDSIVFAWTD